MPDQKMTYRERVKATAKMHADKYNAGGRREYAGGPLIVNKPEHMEDEAELTISLQAEAIRWALTLPYLDHVISHEFVESLLLEHGYIEPKTDEDERHSSS